MTFVIFDDAYMIGPYPVEVIAEQVVAIQRRPSLLYPDAHDTVIEFVGGSMARVKDPIEIVRDKLTKAVQKK